MGWFIVAAILGFLSFWTWRTHIPPALLRENARTTSEFFVRLTYNVLVRFLPITLLIVLVAIPVLKVILETLDQGHLLTQFTDSVGHGTIARFLLGIVLGFGLAYVIEERSRIRGAQEHGSGGAQPLHDAGRAGSKSARKTPRTQNSDNPGHSEEPWTGVTRTGASFLIAIGIAVTLLALAAPHIDRWLSHLTSVKLPFGELQVTSVSTHRGITADNTAFLTDTRSIEYLAAYSTKIQQDIDYIENSKLRRPRGCRIQVITSSPKKESYSKPQKTCHTCSIS